MFNLVYYLHHRTLFWGSVGNLLIFKQKPILGFCGNLLIIRNLQIVAISVKNKTKTCHVK